MKKAIKHLELFAGIGGFRKAIDLFAMDNNLDSKCIGYSEVDKYANMTYQANYETSEEVLLGDISKFTSDKSNIENLPDFDFLSGGFPCQSFSMMGKQLGLDDKRGNLFYDIIEILKVKQPKYVLLENVRNLKTHDGGKTYREILRSLEEDANYFVSADIFNTADFGLPQNRRRIFIFAVRKDLYSDNNPLLQFDFRVDKVRNHLKRLNGSATLKKYETVLDGILEKSVDEKYYLSEKIKPTILSNGSKNFQSKSEINQLIARPLTATMVKMHRACQDNYYSDDFLSAENPNDFLKNYFSKEELANQPIRKLTPLEALKLQGFDKQFYQNAKEAGVSNHQLYKQAGNAVSVNTVYSILSYLYKTQKIEF
jgi:DNA (cytosine-5)-methyltransferase 1